MIKIDKLSFSYRDDHVLKDVSMIVNKGDYIALTGSNGSGKSTLIKLILGLLEAESGSITKGYSSIAYIAQQGLEDISFPVTVNELLKFRLPKNVLSKGDIQAALSRVGMENEGRKLISNLSGGQRQRVLIARELLINPEVLLLDEPTNGLDQRSIESLYTLLKKLNKESQMTIILVTHHIDEDDLDGMRVFSVFDHHVKEVTHV